MLIYPVPIGVGCPLRLRPSDHCVPLHILRFSHPRWIPLFFAPYANGWERVYPQKQSLNSLLQEGHLKGYFLGPRQNPAGHPEITVVDPLQRTYQLEAAFRLVLKEQLRNAFLLSVPLCRGLRSLIEALRLACTGCTALRPRHPCFR